MQGLCILDYTGKRMAELACVGVLAQQFLTAGTDTVPFSRVQRLVRAVMTMYLSENGTSVSSIRRRYPDEK